MEVTSMNGRAKRGDTARPKYIKINSRDLLIPEHAQRKFNIHHGDNLAAHFTMEKYKPIDVSFRNGKYYVIDGQHRLYAMKKCNGGDCSILCYVHYGMTEHDEAMFFLDQMNGVKPILTTDRMRIRYEIGDEVVVDMVRGAEMAGFYIDFGTNKSNNRIVALAALEQAYKALGSAEYCKMLVTLKKAYNGRSDSLVREMLMGMALFFKTYKDKFDPNVLAATLKKNTAPMDIIIEGRSFGRQHNGHSELRNGRPFAVAILNAYNKRRKAPLENLL